MFCFISPKLHSTFFWPSNMACASAAPVVSHTRANMPQTGGGSMTITGLNFGSNDFTATSQISSQQCGSTSWYTSSMLRCLRDSPILHAQHTSVVTVSAVMGTGQFYTSSLMFTFDAPVLSALRLNSPRTGGSLMTVTGLNFGYSELTASSVVRMQVCTTTTWNSDTTVLCHAGIPLSAANSAMVTVTAVVGTRLNLFSYDSPVLSSAALNTPHTGGASVTVTGLNFGYSEVTVSLAIPLQLCLTTSWSSITTVHCLTDSVLPAVPHAMLTIESAVGTQFGLFSFDAPVVSKGLTNVPNTRGAILSIWGLNFGYGEFTPSVRTAATHCDTATWSTSSTLLCATGRRAEAASSIQITLSYLSGSAADVFTFDGVAHLPRLSCCGFVVGQFSQFSPCSSCGVTHICKHSTYRWGLDDSERIELR